MKFELTNGVALAAGLVILFAGADWLGAVGKVVESGATRQLEETVAAEAKAVAIEGELLWDRIADRYRGVVKAGLQNPVIGTAAWSDPEADMQGVENVLATLLDRVKGRGQAAVISSDGKVVSSTVAIKGTSLHKFEQFRAVQDSLGGAAIVRTENDGDASFVVAASPIESANAVVGVLVVTAPIDVRELNHWVLHMSANSVLIVDDRKGSQMASTFQRDVKVPRITQPGMIRIAGVDYWASRRVIEDDAGVAGHIIGLALVSREPVWDQVGKVRRMVLLLGAIALLMTLLVSMFSPAPQPVVQSVAVSAAGIAESAPPPAMGVPAMPMQVASSVSDDLPPLRLDGSAAGGDAGSEGASNLGLAAQLAVAATQDSNSSRPMPTRNEMASKEISEVPTPEHAGDVTMGKGASPRPDAIDAMMGQTQRPKSSKGGMDFAPPPAPLPPPPPPPVPEPVPANPGAFGNDSMGVGAGSADVGAMGATDLPPPGAQEWSDNESTPPFSWDDGAPPPPNPMDAISAPDFDQEPSSENSMDDFSFPSSAPPPFVPAEDDSNVEAREASVPAFDFGGSDSDDSLPPPPFDMPNAAPLDPAPEPEPPENETPSEAQMGFAAQETLMRPGVATPSFTDTFSRPNSEEVKSASIFGDDSATSPVPDPAEAALPEDDNAASEPSESGVMSSVNDGASTIMTSGGPPPPPTADTSDTDATASIEGMAPSRPPEDMSAYNEDHYRSVFDKFVGSKKDLGENVDAIHFDGFSTKLRTSEEKLIEKHGCKAVRFEVLVKDDKVSLRPQLVR